MEERRKEGGYINRPKEGKMDSGPRGKSSRANQTSRTRCGEQLSQ